MTMWCDRCDRPLPIGLSYCEFCGGPIREANMEEVREWMKKNPYRRPAEPPLDPDEITNIMIDKPFHLKKKWPVMYGYSEKTLRYLKSLGYIDFKQTDHTLYMKAMEAK